LLSFPVILNEAKNLFWFLLWRFLLGVVTSCVLSMRERLPAGRSFAPPKRTKNAA